MPEEAVFHPLATLFVNSVSDDPSSKKKQGKGFQFRFSTVFKRVAASRLTRLTP